LFGFGYAIFSKLYIVVVVYVCYVRKLTASAFKICLRHTHTHTQILINFALLLLMTWGVLLFGFQDIRVLLMR
jgi:amino acid permease